MPFSKVNIWGSVTYRCDGQNVLNGRSQTVRIINPWSHKNSGVTQRSVLGSSISYLFNRSFKSFIELLSELLAWWYAVVF